MLPARMARLSDDERTNQIFTSLSLYELGGYTSTFSLASRVENMNAVVRFVILL